MPMAQSEEAFEIYPGRSGVRWLGYLAMMLLFGGFALYLLVLAPGLNQSGLDEVAKVTQVNAIGRRIVRWSWVSILLLLLTSSISLVLQASRVFDKSFVGVAIAVTDGAGHF